MRRKDFLRTGAAFVGGLPFWAPDGGWAAGSGALPDVGTTPDGEALWALVRQLFYLDPEWTYLNTAGLGASPHTVVQCLIDWLEREERAPSAGRDAKEWLAVKEKLAAFLGGRVDKEDLALIGSATEGVNVIVGGLPLAAGDEVITSTHEHVAVNAALLQRRQSSGIVIRLFEPDMKQGMNNVDRIAELMNQRTRLIIISQVTCTTGQRFPEREICRLARERGVFVALDAAQAPGNIPVDPMDYDVDFYTTSTHKWLLAPKRTAFLYVRRPLLDTLRPACVGGFSAKEYDVRAGLLALQPNAQRYEYGTQNEALFYGLGRALDFLQAIGMRRIWEHNKRLTEVCYSALQQMPQVELLSPEEEQYRTAIIGFRVKDRDLKEVAAHFERNRVHVRSVSEGGLNSLRISFHIYNRGEDVDRFLTVLRAL